MSRTYQLISADSHLDLAPDRWTHHVPQKWKERAPRRVQLELGEEPWTAPTAETAEAGREPSVVEIGRWYEPSPSSAYNLPVICQ
jgi:hypothetical protein